MLTLKQCRQLKEWGLPQDVSEKICCETARNDVPFVIHNRSDGLLDRSIWYACPDLEQLLEFANGKISDELKLSPDSHFLSLDCPMASGEWETHYTTTTAVSATDPAPKQAIYKLLEQIIEPNNKVDDSGATEDPLANRVKLSELDETKEESEDG